MSFLPKRFRLRDTDREAPTGHVHAKVLQLQRTALMFARRGDQAVARAAHVSALQMQRKAYLR